MTRHVGQWTTRNCEMYMYRFWKKCLKNIYKFDGSKAGLKNMKSNPFGKQHLWVPIDKTEVDIKIKSSKTSSPVIKRTQYPLIPA